MEWNGIGGSGSVPHFFLKNGRGKKPLQKYIKNKKYKKKSYKADITARQQSSRNKERDKKKHFNNYTRLSTH